MKCGMDFPHHAFWGTKGEADYGNDFSNTLQDATDGFRGQDLVIRVTRSLSSNLGGNT